MTAVDVFLDEETGTYHFPDLKMALRYAEQMPEDALFVLDNKDDMNFMRMYETYVDPGR